MNDKWRQLDLGGGGLQAANLRLAQALRRRSTAWLLLLLFPTGAHGWYLRERLIAAGYPALTLLAASGWFSTVPYAALPGLAGLVLLLIRDLVTLEDRIVACNKRLRMAAYLSQGAAAPAGFRGRFPAQDSAGDPGQPRIPTLSEQEALIRNIVHKQDDDGKPH
ncbi:MAG: hypothetical protein AB7E73_05335 [Burkholderiales bacterium]